MPLGRTHVGHGLHRLVFGRQGTRQALGRVAYVAISDYRIIARNGNGLPVSVGTHIAQTKARVYGATLTTPKSAVCPRKFMRPCRMPMINPSPALFVNSMPKSLRWTSSCHAKSHHHSPQSLTRVHVHRTPGCTVPQEIDDL